MRIIIAFEESLILKNIMEEKFVGITKPPYDTLAHPGAASLVKMIRASFVHDLGNKIVAKPETPPGILSFNIRGIKKKVI